MLFVVAGVTVVVFIVVGGAVVVTEIKTKIMPRITTLMVWPLNVYYSLTPNGGSTTQPPPNLARACPSLKTVFESRPTLPATVCKVSSLHLKSKSFLRSMCKTDFHLFFRVFADDGLYRKNSEITFCVVVSLHFVRLSPNLV